MSIYIEVSCLKSWVKEINGNIIQEKRFLIQESTERMREERQVTAGQNILFLLCKMLKMNISQLCLETERDTCETLVLYTI